MTNGDLSESANYWDARAIQVEEPGVWRNPLGGQEMGCTEWTSLADCFGAGTKDLRFRLRGAPALIFEDDLETGNRGRWTLCNGCSS